MGEILDLKRYKLAKMFVGDVPRLIDEYSRAITEIKRLNDSFDKWQLYSAGNYARRNLTMVDMQFSNERTLLQAALNREENIVKAKGIKVIKENE